MGNCVSFPNQTSQELGISSSSLKQNKNKQGTRFHEGSPSENYINARKAKVLKRPKKIHKGVIGLPSNFQHTGHIGIAEMRSGKVDPEKIKTQMAEVAAALRLEMQITMDPMAEVVAALKIPIDGNFESFNEYNKFNSDALNS
ncbi:3645_t:CDS:2, partial [Scutellospora calospora]